MSAPTATVFNNNFHDPLTAKDKATLGSLDTVGNATAERLLKVANMEPAHSKLHHALHDLASDYESFSQDLASCQAAVQASTTDSCMTEAAQAITSAQRTARVTDSRILGLGAPDQKVVASLVLDEASISTRSAFRALADAGSKATVGQVDALSTAAKQAAQAAVQLASELPSGLQRLVNEAAQRYQAIAADATSIAAAATNAQGVAGFRSLGQDWLRLQTVLGQLNVRLQGPTVA